ncbi:MAG TPA: hypothetical protein VFZ61_01710 [Polyangiales bacterium]
MNATYTFGTLTLLAACSACGEFDPGSLLTHTRVLGARVEVAAAPELASPRPTQRARVSWITLAPRDEPALRSAFVACLVRPDEQTPCSQGPLAELSLEGSEFDLDVPAESALAGARQIAVRGVICDRGEPGKGPDGQPACVGPGAHGTGVTLTIPVTAPGAAQNRNPSFVGSSISLGGQPLGEETGDELPDDCAGSALPQLKADGKKYALELRLGPGQRDLYLDSGGRGELREELQVSHFTSAGELERQHAFVEADDDSEQPLLAQRWTAPEGDEVPPGGRLVRFAFALRDPRGGFAFVRRAACALP